MVSADYFDCLFLLNISIKKYFFLTTCPIPRWFGGRMKLRKLHFSEKAKFFFALVQLGRGTCSPSAAGFVNIFMPLLGLIQSDVQQKLKRGLRMSPWVQFCSSNRMNLCTEWRLWAMWNLLRATRNLYYNLLENVRACWCCRVEFNPKIVFTFTSMNIPCKCCKNRSKSLFSICTTCCVPLFHVTSSIYVRAWRSQHKGSMWRRSVRAPQPAS